MTSTALRMASLFILGLVTITVWGLFSAHTAVSTDALTLSETDVVMGDKNAPVLIIEYASMTCGHCAEFHKTTLPQIKKDFIDTGKARYVLRDMPWDPLALAVSKINRCAPQEKFYNFADAFFQTHNTWVNAKDPVKELKKIARLGGMGSEEVEACLSNEKVHKQVLRSREVGIKTLNINSTPTFFMGSDVVVRGNVGYQKMAEAIERALRRTKQ